MGISPSINLDAVKLAFLVGGSLLTLLLAGQVFRLVSRWLSFAVLVGFVVVVVYITYELAAGWSAAEPGIDDRTEPMSTTPSSEQSSPVELSDAEYEVELEQLFDEDDSGEKASNPNPSETDVVK